MDRTKGEWFENFWIEVVVSILLPFEPRSWETRNLFMRKVVECASDLPLLKVNSSADIFRKLSSCHASIKLYWSVGWCHAAASLLCIRHFLTTPLHSVFSQWLKSPPRMKWSITRFVSFYRFHIDALSFEQ
jgi:hypothetical protein